MNFCGNILYMPAINIIIVVAVWYMEYEKKSIQLNGINIVDGLGLHQLVGFFERIGDCILLINVCN